ncbi:hypothetical protein LWI28_000703 [Acer negundo]|uniref:Secreted protein n=1 Tax=Acer negundo TaxID=4023 RepID=A0AAD5NYZ5_ACENE|nr:hypothetical protein LWI28_000703 [Acer negundo]
MLCHSLLSCFFLYFLLSSNGDKYPTNTNAYHLVQWAGLISARHSNSTLTIQTPSSPIDKNGTEIYSRHTS